MLSKNPMRSTIYGQSVVYLGQRNTSGEAVLSAPLAMIERHRRTNDMGSIRIPLHSPSRPGMYAVINDSDLELINQYRWRPTSPQRQSTTNYAIANVLTGKRHSGQAVYMHRIIANAGPGQSVDHINMNGLDNRRENLRLCSHRQNIANRPASKSSTSIFKGVSYDARNKKWRAQIRVRGKKRDLGRFSNEIDAARAYDECARLEYRDFGRYNFPRPGEMSAICPTEDTDQ